MPLQQSARWLDGKVNCSSLILLLAAFAANFGELFKDAGALFGILN
jgi:hypothetical protein